MLPSAEIKDKIRRMYISVHGDWDADRLSLIDYEDNIIDVGVWKIGIKCRVDEETYWFRSQETILSEYLIQQS